VKALKSFIIYVLHSKIIAYVPSTAVREIMVQPDGDRKKPRLITKILEYNMVKNPTKLIKGQGLVKLLT
jgi:hypothetical protein